MTKTITSREFNQDTGGAKRAAENGPVYITHRGKPAHVLLTFGDYEKLATKGKSLADLLSATPGIGDIDFEIPRIDDLPRPANFD